MKPVCVEGFPVKSEGMCAFTVTITSIIVSLNLAAATRFLECEKCRHFFLFVAGDDQQTQAVDSHTSTTRQEKKVPSPKEVSH